MVKRYAHLAPEHLSVHAERIALLKASRHKYGTSRKVKTIPVMP